MKLLYYLFTVVLLIPPTILFSQSNKVFVAKAPGWITSIKTDHSKTKFDKHASDGFVDLEFQKQVSLADESVYYKFSKKILSAAGVQNASQVSVSFDPTYQQLFFHSINIIRQGVTVNKLVLSKIRITNQEDELDNFIYNGTKEALLILEDVRKGDIIEFSYTKKGFNPNFRDKYSDTYYLSFGYPFYEVYYKLIAPAGRNINYKTFNGGLSPTITSVNGSKIYEWHAKDVPALELQDHTPSWFDPYPYVMLSEYSSWKEVNDWARLLFPARPALSPELRSKIKDLEKASKTVEAKVSAVLKFVQDEIRYMGIEMGANSHKPTPPSNVFSQRFGDCKEKSYLASCMLNSMNIEASPVLISTGLKGTLNDMLPAPTVFDHVTLRVKMDDGYYWYDPTIPYQRGDIKKMYYPDYQAALVIAEGTNALTTINFRNVGGVDVKNYFKVKSLHGSGTLVVTSEMRGHSADLVRDKYNNTNNADIIEEYKKYYNQYFEDIEADSLTYTDNEETGVFTTYEFYSIPRLWQEDKKKGSKFSFSPFAINGVLERVKEKKRKMPFALSFPTRYHEEVMIDLPEEWPVTEQQDQVSNGSYNYSYRFSSRNNIVQLSADFEYLKDHVNPDQAPAYFEDLEWSKEFAPFEITHLDGINADNDKQGKSNLPGIILIAAIAGGLIWWRKRKK